MKEGLNFKRRTEPFIWSSQKNTIIIRILVSDQKVLFNLPGYQISFGYINKGLQEVIFHLETIDTPLPEFSAFVK